MPSPIPSGAAPQSSDIPRRKTCARCLLEIPGFRSSRIAWSIPLVASGQPENEVPDDVPLHLGRAGLDGVSTSSQVSVRPHPFVDRVRIACQQLAVGAEQFLRDLLEALVQLTPEYFLDRALGTRHAGDGDTAEGAHLIETHDFNFGAALRKL